MKNCIGRMQGLLACSMGSVAFGAAARVVMEDAIKTYFAEVNPPKMVKPPEAPTATQEQIAPVEEPALSDEDVAKIHDIFGRQATKVTEGE